MDSDGGHLAAHFVSGGPRLPARRGAPDERGSAARCAMIAGVKGSAVLSALLLLLPWDAPAAYDLAGAVRELARKTVIGQLEYPRSAGLGLFHPGWGGFRHRGARSRRPHQRNRAGGGRPPHL